MKKNIFIYSFISSLILLFGCTKSSFAQVGINTTDPKGIIDFNSTTQGIVYPNVSLTATNIAAPVVNPQGGSLAVGTAVYNTNTTNNGTTTDVHPGIYVWDGSEWRIHYRKRQAELFNQTSVLRPEADFASDFQDVPGLGVADGNTFTAKYNGLYRIEVKTFFGAGRTETNGSSFVAMASGMFRFTFDGNNYDFETSAFSAYSTYLGSGTYLEDIWKESYETRYVNLNAGDTYNLSLTFDAYDAPGFLGNGSTYTIPTTELINENFDNGYSVNQSNNSTGCGGGGGGDSSTNGWVIDAGTCASCVNDSLHIDSNGNSCIQDATAEMSFTPTASSVDISFDYRLEEKNNCIETLRVYLDDGTTPVDLINFTNTDENGSYTGTLTVSSGVNHTLYFEFTADDKGGFASIDNVLITEPMPTTVTEGLGYVGNEVGCQIEITYIGE